MENEFLNWAVPAPQTTKGGKGSGNFGHVGRPGEVGGSGEGKNYTKGELDFSKKILTMPDGFSEKPNLPHPTTGYMVSLPRELGHELTSNYDAFLQSPEKLAQWIHQRIDLVEAQDNLFFGGWAEKGGNFVIDLSENIMSRRQALTLGKSRAQDGIFDYKTMETIYAKDYDEELRKLDSGEVSDE